ncbi:MAG TPA: hypothetical protein VE954_00745, partial [Oligoflexus sp.]
MRGKFPNMATDPFESRLALGFLAAKNGLSNAISVGPSNSPLITAAGSPNAPIAFDWPHVDHRGAQNSIKRSAYSSHKLSRVDEEAESFGWRSEDLAISHHRRFLVFLLPNASGIHTFVWLEGMLARSTTKTFVFETEIVSSPDDFRSLRQSEEHGRKLYNAVLGKLLSSL